MRFANFIKEIPDGNHQKESHLEMAKLKMIWKNFSLSRNS